MSIVAAVAVLSCTVGVAAASSSKVQTSHTFGGYEVTKPTTHIRSVSVTFNVPKITCHKHYSGVGPSVLIDSTVKHNSYSYSGGGIAVACENNVAQYVALPIVDNENYNDTSYTISAGDKITLTVTYGSRTVVKLKDDTTDKTDTRSGKRSLGATAFFGDSQLQVNHKNLGLDAFTKTSFTGVKINGGELAKQKPLRYSWVNKKNTVLISASKITNGDDFSTNFKNAG